MAESAPLALVNGRIITGDARRPRADAALVLGTVVQLVGSSAEVRKLGGSHALVRDLGGAAVTAANGAPIRRGSVVALAIHATADPDSPVVWHWPAAEDAG